MSTKNPKTTNHRKVSRRRLLKIGSALSVGALIGIRVGPQLNRTEAEPERKLVRTNDCLNCTGCIAVCPKNAIISTADGPEIRQDECILCGYCVAICPVAGLKLSNKVDHG